MIISLPNDGRGLLYHILDLNGQTVHAYRDFDAALRSCEGDQRIAILQEPLCGKENRWLTGPPVLTAVGDKCPACNGYGWIQQGWKSPACQACGGDGKARKP
jgi:hypothetical protein